MFRQITPRYSVVDALYFTIGMLTHFYGGALAFLFVFRASSVWPTLVGLLDAMQEPYWGGLGVYVILKEIRKWRRHESSKHYGELFVAMWLVLLAASTFAVFFSPRYDFDEIYKLIITNSLATLVIYIGGLINRP
jgi:hypothetical protein